MIGGGCKCNFKNWITTSLVVAVLYFGMDMFFTHVCLMKLYQTNAQYFRTQEQMMAMRNWGYAAYIVFGLLFTCIYGSGYEEGKSKALQGFRYGLTIGLFYWGAGLLGMYPYFPWPNQLYLGWFGVGLTEFIVLGVAAGVLFKPKQS